MNYDVEMLKLYFKQMNYSQDTINELLNSNPFNEEYALWEKQINRDNRCFASELKNNHLININDNIEEIVVHKNNSITNFLENNSIVIERSINSSIKNVKIDNRKLILISNIFKDEGELLKYINSRQIPFIAGTCTIDIDYYKYALNFYKKILEQLKNVSIETYSNKYRQKMCLIKSNVR